MVPSTHHWFGPDSGDRYRLAVVLLLALLGTPVVSFVVVATVDDPTAAVVLAGTAVLLALVAVGGGDRLQSVMPAVAAAYLAVLVWPTGGLTSDLNIVFLLIALASAVLHTPRWFVANVAWMGTMAMAPFVYDTRGVAPDEARTGWVEGLVLVVAVVVVHVLAQGLRARHERLQVLVAERDVTIAQLQDAQDARDVFLNALSHELRTPLTSIVGMGQTLQRHEDRLRPEERRAMVDRLTANGHRLERLLTELLDLRRLQEGAADIELTVAHLPELVDAALADVDPGGRTVDLDVPPVTVVVDRSNVERIVANLVANACKHTPPDSTVWIRLAVEGGVLQIAVEDDGPGVADELKPVVFEPFRQGSPSREDPSPGTGVGLSLVDRFARLHGGRAWVEDRVGGGAAFRVRLPVEPARVAPPPVSTGSGSTVLAREARP